MPGLSQDERSKASRDAREFLRGAIPIPTAGGGENKPGGKGTQPQGPDRNVMALEAVHPASLERLFQFFERFNQPARNWPIPRQYGGYADPKEEYLVGERGPEIFKPETPGEIIPTEGKRAWGRAYETMIEPSVEALKTSGRWLGNQYQQYIGQPFEQNFGKPIANELSYIATGKRPIPSVEMKLNPTTGTYEKAPSPGMAQAPPYTGPRPWLDRQPVGMNTTEKQQGWNVPTSTPAGENRYRIGEGAWKNMPEDYWKTHFPEGSRGSFNVVPAGPWSTGSSPEQLELAARTRWENPEYAAKRTAEGFTPGYQRSYYEAHPAERAAQNIYEMLNAKTPDQARISRLMDIARDPYATKEARMTAGNLLTEMEKNRSEMHRTAGMMAGGVYQKALEYGPESPESQERLARAQYLKEQTRGFGPLNQAQVDELRARIVREGRMPFVSTPNGVFDTAQERYILPPPDKSSQVYLDMAQKLSTGKDELGNQNYNPEVFYKIIADGIQMGRLSPEYGRLLPKPAGMSEKVAREALKAKGITGKEQDTWINTYKQAGKVQ